MWANAQRDGRPAEHRWRPLFNAAKFGWRPLLNACSNAAKTRKPLKFAGVPQTTWSISAALVKQQYLLHMSPQYGELRPTSGLDRSGSLGNPCKFQRVSRLDNVTARHSSSGHRTNFAALNRGCHLYSAGWPSHWALAHISSCCL